MLKHNNNVEDIKQLRTLEIIRTEETALQLQHNETLDLWSVTTQHVPP